MPEPQETQVIRFDQIAASQGTVYGLTGDGEVYVWTPVQEVWVPLKMVATKL